MREILRAQICLILMRALLKILKHITRRIPRACLRKIFIPKSSFLKPLYVRAKRTKLSFQPLISAI